MAEDVEGDLHTKGAHLGVNFGTIAWNRGVPKHPADGVLTLNLGDVADLPTSIPHHIVYKIQKVLEHFALGLALCGI